MAPSSNGPVAVAGATGYTGRLVVEELVRRGVPAVAVGRSAAKLEALPSAVERRVADAANPASLRTAFAGCSIVASCIGPFIDLGEPVLRAALDEGLHYLDTTGEQAFMRTVFDRFGRDAEAAGVAAVPAIGFDYVPGDMAAALAATELGGPADRVRVAYSVRKARASDGTKRTGMRVMQQPCLVLEGGTLTETRIGAREERIVFPDGESPVSLWPGGEVLTVPRHTAARNVAVFMRMPKVLARMAGAASGAEPLFRAGRTVVGSDTGGPDAEQRQKGTYAVVADAWDAAGSRKRCVVAGRDMYGMTAAAVAEAAVRMRSSDFSATGVLAPAEAFDPASFLSALDAYLKWEFTEALGS